jgi:DNA adenine methylase Dam
MFWEVGGMNSVLSDANAELITTYCAIRDHVDAVIAELRTMPNDKDYFHMVRARDPAHMGVVQVAARMIYLNKTCTNGLYRVNSKGQFNAAFGYYTNPGICNEPRLRACSAALQGVNVFAADFEVALEHAGAGNVVFMDPPYVPASATSSFVGYTAGGFTHDKVPSAASMASATPAQGGLFEASSTAPVSPAPVRKETDQQRLVRVLRDLDRRGVLWMLTNSNTEDSRALYTGWNVTILDGVRRQVSALGGKSGDGPAALSSDIVVRNYE